MSNRPRRILFVEDEAMLLNALLRLFRALGYEVGGASGAAEAIEDLANRTPDVLVTDVILTRGMNGVDLAKVARRDHADLPVIFLSGYARHKISELGSMLDDKTQFLSKPFELTELRGLIDRILIREAGQSA